MIIIVTVLEKFSQSCFISCELFLVIFGWVIIVFPSPAVCIRSRVDFHCIHWGHCENAHFPIVGCAVFLHVAHPGNGQHVWNSGGGHHPNLWSQACALEEGNCHWWVNVALHYSESAIKITQKRSRKSQLHGMKQNNILMLKSYSAFLTCELQSNELIDVIMGILVVILSVVRSDVNS